MASCSHSIMVILMMVLVVMIGKISFVDGAMQCERVSGQRYFVEKGHSVKSELSIGICQGVQVFLSGVRPLLP